MGNVPYDNAPFLLHKNEMVLPSEYADVIRGMAGAGAGGGYSLPSWAATPMRQSLLGGGAASFGAPANDRGGDTHNYYIQAMDGHSFKKFAMDNKHAFAGATHAAVQQGWRPRSGR